MSMEPCSTSPDWCPRQRPDRGPAGPGQRAPGVPVHGSIPVRDLAGDHGHRLRRRDRRRRRVRRGRRPGPDPPERPGRAGPPGGGLLRRPRDQLLPRGQLRALRQRRRSRPRCARCSTAASPTRTSSPSWSAASAPSSTTWSSARTRHATTSTRSRSWAPTRPSTTIRAEFAGTFDVIPATVPQFEPNSGELSIAGIHKAGAIEILLEHLGIPVEDTMAYGDGHNDLEMLAYVDVGRGDGQRPPEGQGRRRRHHRQPRRGRAADQLHQVRSGLIGPRAVDPMPEEVMTMLRVNRVINNNVISVLEDDREVILTGRGLGYQQHPGGTYDPAGSSGGSSSTTTGRPRASPTSSPRSPTRSWSCPTRSPTTSRPPST